MMPLNRIKCRKMFTVLLLFASIIMLFLSGCASVPEPDLKLVKQYKAPVKVGEDETLIYVIRQSAFLGAAQSIWACCNDQYIASLGAGTYCYLKVPSGVNTINLRQMQMPFAFQRVDFRPSETVFLYFELTKDRFYEVDKNVGITMVMSSKKSKKYKGTDKNDDFMTALLNPALVEIELMKDAAAAPKADNDTALVSFIRCQSYAEAFSIGIWNQEGLLGCVKGKNYFTAKLPAGKHTFVTNNRYYSALKADLEAGRHYYVNVEASMGWAQANIALTPVKNDGQSKIKGWMNQSTRVELDRSVIDENIQKRLDAALPLVQEAITKVEKGELEAAVLEKNDGII